jgi:enamine deaminase RidA (YjgF/YER057c/UK114 family)
MQYIRFLSVSLGNQRRFMLVAAAPLRILATLLTLIAAAILAPAAWSDGPKLAISGYDPVAYFTVGHPVVGKPEFNYDWHDSRWLFGNAEHRALFAADPERYAPQYDGYCSMGVAGVSFAAPHKDTVDPEAWAIVDGKLYLTHTTRSMERWRQNAADNIKRADANWSTVRDQAEPTIIGSPCRDQPPSVIVSPKDGRRRVLVGGQLALDERGRLVGKGDMRAQIEQAGQNIHACLGAAGASPSDIILTRAYVTDAAAFSDHAELRARYLGPESAVTVIQMSKLAAGPDFLVEIEAVASLE